MKNALLLLFFSVLFIHSYCQPTNNPYKDKYEKNNHWTDNLPWEIVYNINEFDGSNWDEKLSNAQDFVTSKGGGVIYFPAGTYNFNEDVTVRKNVIIRGANPDCIEAVNDSFAPPTKWVFPKYEPSFSGNGTSNLTAFKKIRSEYAYLGTLDNKPNIRNHSTGLVYIDINRAYIVFHPSVYNESQSGGGTNRKPCYMDRVIIFGIRNNNAAVALPYVPTSMGWQHGWQRWPMHYISNIDALVDEKLVISNNRLNDYQNNLVNPISDDSFKQPGYIVETDDTLQGFEARFEYNDHYGITANRFLNFFEYEGDDYSGGLIIFADLHTNPENNPELFPTEIEINDNWVYQTKRVAMFVAGMGMELKNNVIRDQANKIRYISSNGKSIIDPNAFFENRGIDFTGWDITIEGNDVEVYNTKTGYSGYATNDGEGIMIQECCGGSEIFNYKISKNKLTGTNAYIGLYKVRDINNVEIDSNDLGGENIYVNANTNGSNYKMFNVDIHNNFNVNNIIATGDEGGYNCFVKNNSGTGSISSSCYVVVENNSGLSYEQCDTVPQIITPELKITSPNTDTTLTTDSTIIITAYYDNSQGNMDIVLWDNAFPVDTINSYDVLEFSYSFDDNDLHAFRLSTLGYNKPLTKSKFIKFTGEITNKPIIHEELILSKTDISPVIDGIKENIWQNSQVYKPQNIIIGDSTNNSAEINALWDENSIYIFAEVKDSVVSDSGTYNWDKDQVEIYIDLDYSLGMSFDTNDFKFEILANGNANESKHLNNSIFTHAVKQNTDGYSVEFKLDHNSISGINLSDGSRIGIDIHVIDNDNAPTRDSKISWFALDDISYLFPFAFGSGIFSSELASSNKKIESTLKTFAYPNPFKNSITIKVPENNNYTRIVISSITGKIVEQVNATYKKSISIGQNYTTGTYIVNIISSGGSSSFLIIKE